MKQPAVTPIREASSHTVAVSSPLPNTERDLHWIDEVAALLPEESRLGWYRNVGPWLRMLPPDDEVAHLAYSMGYLALLTRSAPELMAGERAKIAALCQRLVDEISASTKTTAECHHKLRNQLGGLPGEIAARLNPTALAAEIVAAVRDQFLNSEITEAGRLLIEEGDRLRKLAGDHFHTSSDLCRRLDDSRSRVAIALEKILNGSDQATRSIAHWNHEMREVQWISLGFTLLIGVLLGALLCWSALRPPPPALPQQSSGVAQPSAAVSASAKGQHGRK